MGTRFRKSFKIAPGVKVNVGKKSVGISVGGKYGGVSVNSKTGARARVSAPGTGLSYSEKIGRSRRNSNKKTDNANDAIAAESKLSSMSNDELFEYSENLIILAEESKADDEAEYYTKQLKELNLELDRRQKALDSARTQKPFPKSVAILCLIIGIIMIVLSIPMFAVNIIFAIICAAIGVFEISIYKKYRKEKIEK